MLIPVKHLNELFRRWAPSSLTLCACAAFTCSALRVGSEQVGTNSPAAKAIQPTDPSAPARTNASAQIKRKTQRQLSGAELYSVHCNRCHPERYPTERTAAQWKTIMLHMRVRANLPAAQARTILKYLQDNSGR